MIAYTAPMIRDEMALHNVSVRELAGRLDMPMTWVRRAMKYGVSSDRSLQDWMEAISKTA